MRQEIVNKVESFVNNYGMGLGRFRVLQRAYSSVLRVMKPQGILVPVNDYRLYVNMQMGGISAKLYQTNIWEPIETKLFKDALKSLKHGDNVIDVGANIGYYTIMAAKYLNSGIVHSFEPDGANIKLLNKNIAVNGLENVKVYPGAVSNKEQMTPYYRSGDESGAHNIVGSHNLKAKGVVPTVVLDMLNLSNVGLMKVDVEGAEVLVIRGARELLQRSHPILFVECWDEGLRQAGFSVKKLIEEIAMLEYDKITMIDEIKGCVEPYSAEKIYHHFERESYGLDLLCRKGE